jgi:acetyl-CoA carboxylase biotin carboxyl carrier protein
MFTFEQVKDLIDLTVRHKLHELEIEDSGFRLRIRGGAAASEPGTVAPAAASREVAPAAATPPGVVAAATTPATHHDDLHVVTSPIVGTFYASPSPDSPPFVRIGDRVRKGQVLCIVEAMKLMNEIESDADGVVALIHPKNAQPVEYGEPLFGLKND